MSQAGVNAAQQRAPNAGQHDALDCMVRDGLLIWQERLQGVQTCGRPV